MNAKQRFLTIYANLPLAIRNEIIYVTQDSAKKLKIRPGEPMTWNACWIEINNDTPISKQILRTLNELKII